MFFTISYSRPLKLKEEDSDDELDIEDIQLMIKELHESLDYMDSLNINVSIRIRWFLKIIYFTIKGWF